MAGLMVYLTHTHHQLSCYCCKGMVFYKSVDATGLTSRDRHYYFQLMDKIVDEIGEEYVVRIVTDNEAAMKATGKLLMAKRKHLYWTTCTTHCLDLILEDLGKKSSVKILIIDAKKITSFIYNHGWVVNYMEKLTNGKQLICPATTRFATNFLQIECLIKQKNNLQAMFVSDGWVRSRFGREVSGPTAEVKDVVMSSSFWRKVKDLLAVLTPPVRVLELVNSDDKPMKWYTYEALDRAKLEIRKDCRYWKQYWDIIDDRLFFESTIQIWGVSE
ncbi:uncharacterized protein LOC116199913 isoform X1 [Punica granatum]|uniref:Uncharacterized protein LOC116199913 isoform X1 n=1 Tax=Punica granatum TaxID=22663 RepID=A0A6P8D4G0_PUNGR|nr:uncharacterized protein LOC116199913 isoform X1 [Punica granatum]